MVIQEGSRKKFAIYFLIKRTIETPFWLEKVKGKLWSRPTKVRKEKLNFSFFLSDLFHKFYHNSIIWEFKQFNTIKFAANIGDS